MAGARNQSLSINMVMNSAIKGANFLQVGVNTLHKYSTKLQKINLLKATKFPALNTHINSLNKGLQKTQSLTAKISRQSLTSLNAKQARDDLKERLRVTKKIGDYEKQASYHRGKREGQRAGKNTKRVGAGSMIGALALAPLVLPFKTGIDFESKMLRVKALSDATNKEFKMLESSALNLGASTEWKAGQIAEGQQFLTMAGFKPKETVQAMPGLLNLATAGELDLKSTSDIASNIMGAFKIKADKMGMVSDIMAKTITTANVDIRMLGDSLKYSAPIAKKAGLSLADTSAMTGLLGNIGIQGSMAGTSMKSILTRLSSPPKESIKVLDKLHIRTQDKEGNLKNIPSLLQEVYDKTKSKGTGVQLGIMKKIFGLEPLAGGAELIDLAGKGELQKYIGIVNNYEGTAKKISDIQLSGTAGRMKLFGSALEGLSISFSKNLLPPLTSFIEKLTSGLNGLTSWSNKHQNLSSIIYGTAIAIGVGVVALTAFGLVSTMMGTGLAVLGGAFGIVAGGIKLMSLALVANPIGFIIAGIATAGYLIYANWDYLKQNAGAIWQSISTAIKKPFIAVFDWLDAKFKAIINTFNTIKSFVTNFGSGSNETLSQRQKNKNIGLALQITPINNSNFDPTKKVGTKLNQGFSLKEQLNIPSVDIKSPSLLATEQMSKGQVTNNNMQQTHVTNNVTINNQGGTIDKAEFDRAFQSKMADDAHSQADTTFNDVSDVAS
jgi:TP901 family phage tail tape measure protein